MKNASYSIMAGPRDYHTKWSKSKKDKYHMKLLIWGIWNMAQMNLSVTETHRHREQTCGCQGGGDLRRDGVEGRVCKQM